MSNFPLKMHFVLKILAHKNWEINFILNLERPQSIINNTQGFF